MSTSSLLAANLFNVNGLVAVITGGGSGIGRMMARALALNGASKVYILGRRKEALEATAASVSTSNIIPKVCDVTSKEALESVASAIKSEIGYVNVLIANAGIIGAQSKTSFTGKSSISEIQSIWQESSFEQYAQVFNVNTVATWFTVVAFLGLLDEGNKAGNVEQTSQIIATSSIAGFLRISELAFSYGQSKAALISMVKQLATYLTHYGIRVNALCPGLYPSEMTDLVLKTRTVADFNIPLQRAGREEDIAGYILYLTSKAGGYLSGEVTISDGGFLSASPSSY